MQASFLQVLIESVQRYFEKDLTVAVLPFSGSAVLDVSDTQAANFICLRLDCLFCHDCHQGYSLAVVSLLLQLFSPCFGSGRRKRRWLLSILRKLLQLTIDSGCFQSRGPHFSVAGNLVGLAPT